MLSASRESSFVRGLNEKGRSLCEISGTVQKTQKTESGYKITLGRVKLISDGGRLENCIVYTDREYGRGAMLRIKGTAAAFDTAKNPGEFDSRQYYRTLRVAFKLYAEEISFVKNNALFVTGLADRLSKKLRASLYSVTDSASASVFAAMLLGEKDGLDTELSELFAAYGIGHILAISGVKTLSLEYIIQCKTAILSLLLGFLMLKYTFYFRAFPHSICPIVGGG